VLWWLAVLSIGLAKLGRSTFGRAAVWIFGIYIVLMAILVGVAALRFSR
jgi:type IV secretory pathway VirB2 component (pilin)